MVLARGAVPRWAVGFEGWSSVPIRRCRWRRCLQYCWCCELGHGGFGEVAAVSGDPFVVHVDQDRADQSVDRCGVGTIPTKRERRLISLLTGVYPALLARSRCSSRSAWPDAVEVLLEGCGDVPVSCFFSGPAAVLGVGLECLDVGELVGERR